MLFPKTKPPLLPPTTVTALTTSPAPCAGVCVCVCVFVCVYQIIINLCRAPLGSQFWTQFPQLLKDSQRDQPEGLQVTLEHVHRRIVVNTLRVLRQDPLSSLARNESQVDARCLGGGGGLQRSVGGCYVACVSINQPLTCEGQNFDSICDIKKKNGVQSKNIRGAAGDWEALAQKISDENSRTSKAGGGGGGGSAAGDASASDAGELQPVFVSDQERPQAEADKLMDFRMLQTQRLLHLQPCTPVHTTPKPSPPSPPPHP